MNDQNELKSYDASNIPDDAEFYNKPTVYKTLPDDKLYQVQILKAELRDNPFWVEKPDKEANPQTKYQFSFELVVLNEGEFYGRRIWVTTAPAFKPEGRKGASKLFRIVTLAMQVHFDWDDCSSFAPDLKTFIRNLSEQVIGKQLIVGIENTTKNDKVYTNVTSFAAVEKELPKFTPREEPPHPADMAE